MALDDKTVKIVLDERDLLSRRSNSIGAVRSRLGRGERWHIRPCRRSSSRRRRCAVAESP